MQFKVDKAEYGLRGEQAFLPSSGVQRPFAQKFSRAFVDRQKGDDMGAGFAAMLLGALVPTFLLSRLLLWITKRWNGGLPRLLLVHVICGSLAVVAAAYGYSHTGAPDWSNSALYIVAQLVWLVVDFVRGRRRQNQPAS